MNIQPKFLNCFLYCFIFFISPAEAQNFFYSAPVGNFPYTQTKIIGSVKDNIIVWGYTWSNRYDKRKSEIWVYDDEMKLLNKNSFAFLQSHEISSIDFINEGNSFSAVVQYINNGNLISELVSFDANANVLNTQLLERSNNPNDDGYVIVKSAKGKSLTLLKVVSSEVSGTIGIQYHFIKNDSVIRSDKFVLPFDTLSSELGKAFLDDDNLIIPVKERMENGERLALFKVDLKNNSSVNTLRDLHNGELFLSSTNISENGRFYIITSEWKGSDKVFNEPNKIFIWQLNKDLTDVSSDTLLAGFGSLSSCLQNIHYYNLHSIALKNNVSELFLVADEVTREPVYFSTPGYSNSISTASASFYEGRVFSMVPQKDLNGNGYYAQSNVGRGPTWLNNSGSSPNGFSQKLLPQPATLAILNIDTQNKLHWSQCFNVSMEEHFRSLVNESTFVNTKNALHIIYPKLTEKDKQSLNDIILKQDGSYTIKPVVSMDVRYNYLINQAVQLDAGSLLIPCTIKGKLAFAKLKVE